MPESVVLLHGFSGTHRAWDGVIGHARPLNATCRWRSTSPATARRPTRERPITFAGCVAHVLARSPERFALCGYSLGGRVALHVALAAPERVSRLVLVVEQPRASRTTAERAARRDADRALADELEAHPVRGLHRALAHAAAVRRRPAGGRRARARGPAPQPPGALAAVLRGIGTGRDGSRCGSGSASSTMPVTVLVGERDAKFRALGRRMVRAAARRRAARRRRAATACRSRTRAGGRRARSARARALERRRRPSPAPRAPRSRPSRTGSGSRGPRTARASPGRSAAAARARRAPRRRAPRRPRRAGRRASRPGRPRRRRRARAWRPPAGRRCRRSGRSSGRPRRPRRPPSAPCSAAVSSIATRTATRSRTSRTASQAVRRLLDELQAGGGERVDRAHRLLDVPRAVGVEAQRHRGSGRGADRRHAPGVVADADLQLHARRSPSRTAAAACSAAPARSSARQRRVDGHLARPGRRSAAPPRACPRGVRRDPTAPGRSPPAPPAGPRRRRQASISCAPFMSPRSRQHRAVALERRSTRSMLTPS